MSVYVFCLTILLYNVSLVDVLYISVLFYRLFYLCFYCPKLRIVRHDIKIYDEKLQIRNVKHFFEKVEKVLEEISPNPN